MSDGQRTVRLAMVGCGGIARAHLRGYEQIHKVEPDKLEIVALCDPVRENAEAFADTVERFQGKRPRLYADHETMLKEEAGNLDAGTHDFRAAQSRRCRQLGSGHPRQICSPPAKGLGERRPRCSAEAVACRVVPSEPTTPIAH